MQKHIPFDGFVAIKCEMMEMFCFYFNGVLCFVKDNFPCLLRKEKQKMMKNISMCSVCQAKSINDGIFFCAFLKPKMQCLAEDRSVINDLQNKGGQNELAFNKFCTSKSHCDIITIQCI